MCHVSLHVYDQMSQLKSIRDAGDMGIANVTASRDVLMRVDRAFSAFFQRVKAGQIPGFPRFKSPRRFNSYTFPVYGNGCRIRDNGRLYIQGVGEIKVKLHRPIDGRIKTVTIKREAGRWYACFSVECVSQPLPTNAKSVGIDLGLTSYAVQNDGTVHDNPRVYEQSQGKLRRAQRKVARRKKGSNRRRKAVQLLQKTHMQVQNQRGDFQHKLARHLVDSYGLICAEKLNVKGLARGILPKQVHDAAWSSFLDKLAYKAEEAGRQFVQVNPNGTSQCCPCGNPVPKKLGDRWHHCNKCGLSVPRDQASAMEILRLGLSLVDGTWPSGAGVSTEAVSYAEGVVT